MASTKRKIFFYFCFIILGIWIIFPIYSLGLYSFMPDWETIAIPTHWIPEEPTLYNYALVLGLETYAGRILAQSEPYRLGLINSAIVALATTFLAMLVSSTAAYAFSRYRFRAKNAWLLGLLLSRMVPAAVLVIPYYIMYATWRLIGTHIGMIMTYLAISIPLATWILIGYFSSLPVEVERAARIDGCGRLATLFKVVIPMAGSGLASVGVIIFLLTWGEFLFALILSSGTPAMLFPPALVPFLGVLAALSYPTQAAAATMITLIPVTVVAVIFQRYITRLKIVDPVTITVEKGPLEM